MFCTKLEAETRYTQSIGVTTLKGVMPAHEVELSLQNYS